MNITEGNKVLGELLSKHMRIHESGRGELLETSIKSAVSSLRGM